MRPGYEGITIGVSMMLVAFALIAIAKFLL